MPSILSTKKLSPAQKNLLLNAGMAVVEYDAIHIKIIDFEWKYNASKKLIFTSQNAVNSFLEKFSEIKSFSNLHCFCVGEKTALKLQNAGFKIKEVAHNADGLSKIITNNYSNEEFVFFCGNKRMDLLISRLKSAKIELTEVVVYSNSSNEKKIEQEFDGILFFSPSGIKSFTSKNKLKESIAFCIGNTTASEAKKYTEKIKIATKQSIENVIVQVVKEFSGKL